MTTTHAPMPSHAATVTIHQPGRAELWLAAQPAAPKAYEGRHRGRPAVEVTPQEAPARAV